MNLKDTIISDFRNKVILNSDLEDISEKDQKRIESFLSEVVDRVREDCEGYTEEKAALQRSKLQKQRLSDSNKPIAQGKGEKI